MLYSVLSGKSLWLRLVAAVLLFGGGYLCGRSHLLRDLRLALTERRSPLPPGPPEDPQATETFAQLDTMLNRQLRQQHTDSSRWYQRFQETPLKDVPRIQSGMRRELQKLLENLPISKVALSPDVEPWFTRDGVEVSLVRFTTFPGVRLLCALMKPFARDRLPAILALHGVAGSFQKLIDDTDYHHGFAFQLAKHGFLVLAPVRVGSNAIAAHHLNAKAIALGTSLEAIEMRQLRTAIDYLYSLDVVDQAHIGVYGISLGGNHALKLGALDTRLSMVLSSGYVSTRFWRTFAIEPTFEGSNRPDPRDFNRSLLVHPSMSFLLHDANLASLIYPRFLGVESGTNQKDRAREQTEFDTIQRVYTQLGAGDRVEFLSFPGGHETSLSTALPFINRWAAWTP